MPISPSSGVLRALADDFHSLGAISVVAHSSNQIAVTFPTFERAQLARTLLARNVAVRASSTLGFVPTHAGDPLADAHVGISVYARGSSGPVRSLIESMTGTLAP